MTILLDHTIVPSRDKLESARFFARIFGLEVAPAQGIFAPVRVNDSLTLDFSDDADATGGWAGQSHHYAFLISEAEFDAIFARIQDEGVAYGSGPHNHTDGRINRRRGGRGFYFEDPAGHLLEVMTVAETGSAA